MVRTNDVISHLFRRHLLGTLLQRGEDHAQVAAVDLALTKVLTNSKLKLKTKYLNGGDGLDEIVKVHVGGDVN